MNRFRTSSVSLAGSGDQTLVLSPTPTRRGAEATASADCRGAGVVADAIAGAIPAD